MTDRLPLNLLREMMREKVESDWTADHQAIQPRIPRAFFPERKHEDERLTRVKETDFGEELR